MSNEAINWAFAQQLKSSQKFLLVAMANIADSRWACWPSYKYLSDATGQDIKTIASNLRKLREFGYITDTNQRKGPTGRVVVYQLNTPDFGGIKDENNEVSSDANTPKNGAIPPVVIPPNLEVLEPVIPPNFPTNPPEIGGIAEKLIPPNFPGNTPKFPVKYPQISHVIPPNLGDGYQKKPNRHLKEPKVDDIAACMDLLQDVQPDVLKDWQALRKQKKARISRTAVQQICREAEKAGLTLNEALTLCCARGWAGFDASWASVKTFRKTTPSVLGKTGQATAANVLRWLEKVEQKEVNDAGN